MSECKEEAEEFIEELIATGKCERVEITGSLRRGEPYTHDVDIVCADPSIPPRRSMREPKAIKIDKTLRNGCVLEVYRANPLHYGAMLLNTTGPAGSSIGMRKQAEKKGLKLNHYGLWKDDTLISENWSEDEICREILGRPCKSPEERGR